MTFKDSLSLPQSPVSHLSSSLSNHPSSVPFQQCLCSAQPLATAPGLTFALQSRYLVSWMSPSDQYRSFFLDGFCTHIVVLSPVWPLAVPHFAPTHLKGLRSQLMACHVWDVKQLQLSAFGFPYCAQTLQGHLSSLQVMCCGHSRLLAYVPMGEIYYLPSLKMLRSISTITCFVKIYT